MMNAFPIAIPDHEFRPVVKAAILECLAERVYPGGQALRVRGVRGDSGRIVRAFRELVEADEVVLPAWAIPRYRQLCAMARTKTIGHVPRELKPHPRAVVALDPLPERESRKARRDYREAWRNIRKMRPVEVVEEVADVA